MIWEKQINYEEASSRMDLGNLHDKFPKSYLISILEKSSFDNDEYLFLPGYRNALWNALYIKYYIKYGNDKLLIRPLFKIAKTEFTGQSAEYLQFTILKNALDQNSSIKTTDDIYKIVVDEFLEKAVNGTYINYLLKNKILKNSINNENDMIDINNKPTNIKNICRDKSITYIDFWASWCAPCRAEMPASKKLYDEYNNKGVNFIYISIDANAAAWGRAISQLGLPNSQNYLLPKPKESLFIKDFKVNSIPRYMILKKGRVLYSDAPRPSDSQIRKVFDSSLRRGASFMVKRK